MMGPAGLQGLQLFMAREILSTPENRLITDYIGARASRKDMGILDCAFGYFPSDPAHS